jgi:hypothetical protein
MKLFCHISEFEAAGWENLPVMLFCSDRVTLWSPSASSINAAYAVGRSVIRSEELLELVRAGYVQVIGRRPWLTDPATRAQSNYEYKKWESTFDTHIADLGINEEKERTLESERKVRFIGPEDGYQWADMVLDSAQKKDQVRVQIIAHRLEKRQLPPGSLEKADRESSERAKIRVALRDARNHAMAHAQSAADLPIEPSVGAEVIAEVCSEVLVPSQKVYGMPTEQRLWEIFEVLRSISAPRTYSDFVRLLERADRREAIRDLGALSRDDTPVAQLLSSQIVAGAKEPTWLQSLVPQTRSSGFCTVVGLFVGIAGFTFISNPEVSLITGGLGTVVSLIGELSGPAEKLSWLRSSQYAGPRYPFVLAYGHETPTYQEIRELHQRLNEIRR